MSYEKIVSLYNFITTEVSKEGKEKAYKLRSNLIKIFISITLLVFTAIFLKKINLEYINLFILYTLALVAISVFHNPNILGIVGLLGIGKYSGKKPIEGPKEILEAYYDFIIKTLFFLITFFLIIITAPIDRNLIYLPMVFMAFFVVQILSIKYNIGKPFAGKLTYWYALAICVGGIGSTISPAFYNNIIGVDPVSILRISQPKSILAKIEILQREIAEKSEKEMLEKIIKTLQSGSRLTDKQQKILQKSQQKANESSIPGTLKKGVNWISSVIDSSDKKGEPEKERFEDRHSFAEIGESWSTTKLFKPGEKYRISVTGGEVENINTDKDPNPVKPGLTYTATQDIAGYPTYVSILGKPRLLLYQ